MTISERIFDILKEKKITQTQLANALSTKQSTIASWKKQGSQPSSTLIVDIAKTLDVSIEYLLTGEESKQEHYTKEEQRLTCIYRATNPIGRQRIMEYASEMKKLHPEQEEDQENLSTSKIS